MPRASCHFALEPLQEAEVLQVLIRRGGESGLQHISWLNEQE
jgi:hypothetical protein